MNHFDLNFLRSFINVVQAGSYATAARRLGIPANTLSRQVQALESALGVRLIQRSTRQFAITDAGTRLFDMCEEATAMLVGAGQTMLDFNKAPAGLVRVAAPADFFDFFEPAWVAAFLSGHPKVQLDFTLNDSLTDLIGNRIDVAFRAGRLPDSQMMAKRLDVAHFVFVAAPSYVAVHGTPHTVQELHLHKLVLHRSAGSMLTLSTTSGDEETKVEACLSADNTQAILRACIGGVGIGLVPVVLAAKAIKVGALLRVLPTHWRDGGCLYAVFPDRKHIPPAVSLFADVVAERIRSLGEQVANSTHVIPQHTKSAARSSTSRVSDG